MTTLIAWTAIDQNVATAIYVASDSRLSWGMQAHWDAGRKIFASERFPEILGYTGDALFCSQVLGQLISFIDACAPLDKINSHTEKFLKVAGLLRRAFSTYPQKLCLPAFSVFYLTRVGTEWAACTFRWSLDHGWLDMTAHEIITTAQQRAACGGDDNARAKKVIFVSEGSGGTLFRSYYEKSQWSKKLPLLSRSIFGAFCDFVSTKHSTADPHTGGTPQLSCLYKKRGAQKIGFVEGSHRYLYGIELDAEDLDTNVRWVNRTFENCAPGSGLLLPGEQRQPAPRELRSPEIAD